MCGSFAGIRLLVAHTAGWAPPEQRIRRPQSGRVFAGVNLFLSVQHVLRGNLRERGTTTARGSFGPRNTNEEKKSLMTASWICFGGGELAKQGQCPVDARLRIDRHQAGFAPSLHYAHWVKDYSTKKHRSKRSTAIKERSKPDGPRSKRKAFADIDQKSFDEKLK